MAVDFNQLAAQDAAFAKQAAAAREAEQNQQKQAEPSFLQKWVTGPVGRVTTQAVDAAVSAADSMYDTPVMRKARDAVAGGITGAVNMADSARSFAGSVGQNFKDTFSPTASRDREINESIASESDAAAARTRDIERPAVPSSPIWDHAKQNILDFRDAVAVSDPTWADNAVQALGQFALPFAGFSRALAGVHGFANLMAAGALTDATAQSVDAPREATGDLLALARHLGGKYVSALNAANPVGHALNAYVNFLADNSNGTEAEARFKQALDGAVPNLILTPLLHAGGVVLKQGTAGLRFLADRGVRSLAGEVPAQTDEEILAGVHQKAVQLARSTPPPGSPRAQRGSIGVPTPRANNASGESAASQEAINRGARNLDLVDPDGNGSPILKDVTQVDQQPPKGHVIIDRDTGDIVARGPDLKPNEARALRARYEARRIPLKDLSPEVHQGLRDAPLHELVDDSSSLADLEAQLRKYVEKEKVGA